MKIADVLKPGERGVIGTASKNGVINMAAYAVLHVVDDETVAWGMTDGSASSSGIAAVDLIFRGVLTPVAIRV